MKTFNIEECSIPGSCAANLKNDFGILYNDYEIPDMYRVLFSAITTSLNTCRTKKTDKVGFVLFDTDSKFIMGAIAYFIKPEDSDEEDSGNWYLEMTFDESDLEGCDIKISSESDLFIQSMAHHLKEIVSGRFENVPIMHRSNTYLINTLKDFLDVNATEGEEVEVTLRGVFTASVIVEDGAKVMSIVPGEIIKQAIKKDAIL